MKLDRMLFLAAVLFFVAAWGVYELGLGSRFPVMAATQSGLVPVPEEHMRDCLRQRVLTLFGDNQALHYWRACQEHFSRYRALGALELRINALLGFSLLGTVLLFAFAAASRLKQPAAKIVWGPTRFESAAATRAVRKSLRKECKLSGEGLDLIQGMPMSRDRESRHFLIWGSVGAGKTQIMLRLILGAIARGDGVVVLDVKGDMTASLPGHPILIAPQDHRSAVWNVASDCRTKQDARELAARIIPASADPMWSDAAREIFVACAVHLQQTRGSIWSWRDLQETATLGADKLLEIAKRCNPNAIRSLENPDSKTTQGILSTFQSHMNVVATLADAWDENENPRFSVSDWLHNPPPFRPVILQQDGRYPKLSAAWMGGLISLLASAVGSPTLEESRGRRVWLFLDEFPQLPRLDQFSTLIDLGRSKGIITVIGAQDIAQLRETYGRNRGDSWMSMIGTQIVARLNLSHAAKEISELIGYQELEKPVKTRTQTPSGTSVTWRKERERRPVISPPELATRLGPTRKGVKALVLGVGEDIYELTFPYITLEKLRPSSVPARWTTEVSKPMSPQGGAPEPAPDSPSNGPKGISGVRADAIRRLNS
jgi:hypothetical protein